MPDAMVHLICLVVLSLLLPSFVSGGKALSECRDKTMDVYILADVSDNLRDKDLNGERKGLLNMMKYFDMSTDGIRVGLITYDKAAHHIFSLGAYSKLSQVKKLGADLLQRNDSSQANLDLALDLVVKKFKDEARKNVPQIAIAITNGDVTAPGRAGVSAQIIHDLTNITVVTIGIGNYVDRRFIDNIATGRDGENTYVVKSFLGLKGKYLKPAVSDICQVPSRSKNLGSCRPRCLRNGRVLGRRQVGDIIRFDCDDGYDLIGEATALCQPNKTWSYKVHPRCAKRLRCDYLVGTPGGDVSYADKSKLNGPQGRAQFTCEAGYKLTTPYSELNCYNWEKWSAAPPTCKHVRCDSFSGLYGGVVQELMTTSGQVVTFTCNTGYTLVGANKLTCTEGQWNGTKPTCQNTYCTLFRGFKNGKVSYNFDSENKTASFVCDAGSTLQGPQTIQCSDGRWESEAPECRDSQCERVTGIRYGRIEEVNGQLVFSCIAGYKLVGAESLNCSEGKWSDEVPVCQKQECLPSLTEFRNGKVENAYAKNPGDKLTFSCDSGYTLDGATVVECGEDERWSAPFPTCRDTKCPALYNIENGKATGNGEVDGSTRTLSCDRGYVLRGPAVVTCANNAWDLKASTCVPNMCPPVEHIANGVVKASNSQYAVGDTLKVTCNRGYELGGSDTVTCLSTNEWSAFPICRSTVGSCDPLVYVHNGVVKGTKYTVGSTVTIKCIKRYVLSGSATVKCQENEDWSTIPTCEPAACTPLQYVTNGRVKGDDYAVGRKVKVMCDKGYKLSGPENVECLASRQWAYDVKCTRHRCPTILSFPHGRVKGYDTVPGSNVRFQCDSGYRLEGVSSINCTEDAEWTDQVPSCQADTLRVCDDLCIRGGDVDYYGDKSGKEAAAFSCEHGWDLYGESRAKCTANGTWSETIPKCLQRIPDDCRRKYHDLYFVVDESKTFKDEEIDELRQLIIGISQEIVNSQFGVITYSKDAKLDVSLRTNDVLARTRFLQRTSVFSKVNIVGAMNLLAGSYDDVRRRRPRRAIVISGKKSDSATDAIAAAQKVRDVNGKILVLSVGDKYDKAELNGISSGKDDSHVIYADDVTDLIEKRQQIAARLCTL